MDNDREEHVIMLFYRALHIFERYNVSCLEHNLCNSHTACVYLLHTRIINEEEFNFLIYDFLI